METGQTFCEHDICVVGGGGHIGLPLSLVLAEKGYRVIIQDINREGLEAIGRGEVPFIEHGSEELLRRMLDQGRLSLAIDIECLSRVDTVIITIGTPIDEFMSPDIKVIRRWLEKALPYLRDGQMLILRSTVYPGTTDWLNEYIRRNSNRKLNISYCPERIVQGLAIDEIQKLPQIISGVDQASVEKAEAIFSKVASSVVLLEPLEAEFAKLFTNAYRYIQFAAANQFYMIANDAGVDYSKILAAMKTDYPRARDIPGAGLTGGPCLLKDTMQLAAFSENNFVLGNSAMLVNEGLALYIKERIRKKYDIEDKVVGLLGMAFKADNDDIRSSLSYKLKRVLQFHAREVLTTDPHVRVDPVLVPLQEALSRSDILVLCAPHSEYRNLDTGGKPLIDIWNFFKRGSTI